MTQLLNALPGALAQGLIWGVMAIGVYITYKVLDIADLTVDGSICTGAAVCTMLLLGGQSPWLALLLAGILLVMGAYRLFSWLCSRGLTDTLTWVLGAAALVLAALGLLLASRSFRRLKELHL